LVPDTSRRPTDACARSFGRDGLQRLTWNSSPLLRSKW
jgi:hypothetical protein